MITLGLSSTFVLFLFMLALAALPSTSVMIVASRSALLGFRHGVAAAAGVVVGDLVFVLLAAFGLAMVAQVLGEGLVWLKYVGCAYLLWFGVTLWRGDRNVSELPGGGGGLWSSFLLALSITLGDLKAIFFYLSFLPAFVDLEALTALDLVVLSGVVVMAVGLPKLGYALLATRVLQRTTGRLRQQMRRLLGVALIAVAGYVAARA